jgi:hypothetical protein
MRRALWLSILLSAFGTAGACSSGDDDNGGGLDGGSNCTCDFAVNGEAKRLTCGQSACVNGATATCRADARSDVVPGCASNDGGAGGAGGGSDDLGGSDGDPGGSGGSGGNRDVGPDGCYRLSLDGPLAPGRTASSVIGPVSTTLPGVNDEWRLQVIWFEQTDPTLATYDLSNNDDPSPEVYLGIPNVVGDVLDGFFAVEGTVTLSALPNPINFSASAGSLAGLKFRNTSLNSACLRLEAGTWDTD